MERMPQGILHRHAAESRFTVSRLRPDPSLREHVEYYWVVRWDLHGRPPHEQRVLPNLATHAVFGTGSTGVWGPSRSVFTQVLRDRGLALGVRVAPGCCRAVLGVPVTDLRAGPISLPQALGAAGQATDDAVRRASGDAELATVVDRLLTDRVRPLTGSERLARTAVSLLATDPAITRVDHLAGRTGMTVRALQRLFTGHIGTGPKWAIRVYRLNDAAARLASDSPPTQAALAAELGYSDQAHFVRDFTSLVGTPPGAYERQQKVTK
ncbi:helix-turn-helix domain-containing protein [Saccharomonospora azurea]|uniref:helix-turn-helix domain-containing protein n=1 Tax=Saccharomonospora azurea TaxID=40988 RepID=UPI003D8DB532